MRTGFEPWQVRDLEQRLRGEVGLNTPKGPVRLLDSLPGGIGEAFIDEKKSFSRVCGRALARQADRRFPSGLCLKKGRISHKTQQWVVVDLLEDGGFLSEFSSDAAASDGGVR